MIPRVSLPCRRRSRVRRAALVIRVIERSSLAVLSTARRECKPFRWGGGVFPGVWALRAYGRIGGCFDGSPPESRTAPSLLRFSRDFPPVFHSRSIRCGLILLAAN